MFKKQEVNIFGYGEIVEKMDDYQNRIENFTEDHLHRLGYQKVLEQVSIGCKNMAPDQVEKFIFSRKYAEPPRVFVFGNFFSISYRRTNIFQKHAPRIEKWNEKWVTIRAPKLENVIFEKAALQTASIYYLAVGGVVQSGGF